MPLFFAVIVCGIIYCQHNLPDYFLMHLEKIIEKMVSDDMDVYIMGDFNIDLLKCESSQIRQDYLLSLRSCYLIPTGDKPSCVHRTSPTLIDNIFVNNPDQLVANRNIISDISDHFSQFCLRTSAKDKLQQVKNIKNVTIQDSLLNALTKSCLKLKLLQMEQFV